MSRDSRLAKRDAKLKKLAAKRGLDRLPPQKKTTGDLIHTARALRAAHKAQLLAEAARVTNKATDENKAEALNTGSAIIK